MSPSLTRHAARVVVRPHGCGASDPVCPTPIGNMARLRVASESERTVPAPLVGRERDVAELVELLARPGMVTLTGPAGVGKSRLAREVAGRVGAALSAPVVVVNLAALTCGADVGPTVASAIQRRTQGPADGLVVVLDDSGNVPADWHRRRAETKYSPFRVMFFGQGRL